MNLQKFSKYLTVFLISLIVLAGCGGSNDGGEFKGNSNSDSNNTQQNTPQPTQNKKTITGYVIDDPVVGATIEVYDANGTLLTKEENATDSSGKFSIEDKYNSANYIIKAYNGFIKNTPFKSVLVAKCSKSAPCYITPYKTMINIIKGGFLDNSEVKAKEFVADMLGVNDDPFENNNTQEIESFKKAIGKDGSKLTDFIYNFYSDAVDGYIDNNETISYFPNAKKRVVQNISFKIDSNITNDKDIPDSIETKLVSVSTQKEGIDSVETKGYPSDVSLIEHDKDTNQTVVLYNSFNVGVLKNQVNAKTEVAFEIFSGDISLALQPLMEKERIVNELVKQEEFKKASELYNKLINDDSDNYAQYDHYINTLTQYAKSLIKQPQKDITQRVLQYKLAKLRGISSREYDKKYKLLKRYNKTIPNKTTMNINDIRNQVPLKIMDGMLLNIGKDKQGGDQIIFDFTTNLALWYAVVPKSDYDKKDDWKKNLLDPNLITPKTGWLDTTAVKNNFDFESWQNQYVKDYFSWHLTADSLALGYGFASTPMNIANFDADMMKKGITKEYVVYRNKPDVYLDLPILMNTLEVFQIVADMLEGISLSKPMKNKKKRKEIIELISDTIKLGREKVKEFLESPTGQTFIVYLEAFKSFSKEYFSYTGVDITTIDQRYGVIDEFYQKFSSLLKSSGYNNYEKYLSDKEKNDMIKSLKLETISSLLPGGKNQYYKGGTKTFYTKIKGKRVKKIKQIRNYKEHAKLKLKLFFLQKFLFAKLKMSLYTDEQLKKEIKEDDRNIIAFYYAKHYIYKKYGRYADNSHKIWIDFIDKIDIHSMSKEQIKKFIKNQYTLGNQLIKNITFINNYIYKIKNLFASINPSGYYDIIKNIIIQIVKDSYDSATDVIIDKLESISAKMIGGGPLLLVKASNKLFPMIYTGITKPSRVNFTITSLGSSYTGSSEKLNKYARVYRDVSNNNYLLAEVTIPAVFDNLNYLKVVDKNYILGNSAPIAKENGNQLDLSIDSNGNTNLLLMPGAKLDFNNVAILTDEDMATEFFKKKADEYIAYANWHVYKQQSYDWSDARLDYKVDKSTAYVNPNTGESNYWVFYLRGKDLLNPTSYSLNGGNKIVDNYLEYKKLNSIKYFSFDTFWKKAGHTGIVKAQTPGIYSINSDLWLGKKKEVFYKNKFNYFVTTDYDYSTSKAISHRDMLIKESKYSLDDNSITLYLKLYRDDKFNYYPNWSKFKHGKDFYLFVMDNYENMKFGPYPITLGENGYSIVNLPIELKDKLLDGRDKIYIVDSIFKSYVETFANNDFVSMFVKYKDRKENGKLARPFMVVSLKDLKVLKTEKIDIKVSSDNITEGDSVTFSIDKNLGDNYTYEWRDGDKIISHEATFTIDNLSVGKHTISLIVKDGDEIVATAKIEVEVKSGKITIEKIELPQSIMVKKEVSIKLSLKGKKPYNIKVDWGSGQTAEYNSDKDSLIMTNNYSKAGKYKVKITISNGIDIKVVEKELVVLDAPNKLPVINAFVTPMVAVEHSKIKFDASKSYDPDGKIAKYEWKENNKILSQKALFEIDTLSAGKHKITLQVTDNKGGYVTKEFNILIIAKIKPTSGLYISEKRAMNDFAISNDGKTAFIANGKDGLVILDISDYSNPKKISSIKTEGAVVKVLISESKKWAYIIDSNKGLMIYDIKDLTQPKLLGTYKKINRTTGVSWAITNDGNSIIYNKSDNQIVALNVSDPKNIDIYKKDSEGSTKKKNGFDTFDIQDYTCNYLENPLKGSFISGSIEKIAISKDDKFAYVTTSLRGLYKVDIQNLDCMKVKEELDGSYSDFVFSKDGNKIFALSEKNNKPNVSIISLAGEKMQELTSFNVWGKFIDSMYLDLSDDEKTIYTMSYGQIYSYDISDYDDIKQISVYYPLGYKDGVVALSKFEVKNNKLYAINLVSYPKRSIFSIATKYKFDYKFIDSYDSLDANINDMLLIPEKKLLLVANGSKVSILDISDINHIKEISKVQTKGDCLNIKVSNDNKQLFIADNNGGLIVVDISNIKAPKVVSNYQDMDEEENIINIKKVFLSSNNKLAYVLSEFNGLEILNIENPNHIIKINSYNGKSYSRVLDIAVSSVGKVAYLATSNEGVLAVNIKDPLNITKISNIPTDGETYINNVYLSSDNNTLYSFSLSNSLYVINVSNINEPKLINSFFGYTYIYDNKYHSRDNTGYMFSRDTKYLLYNLDNMLESITEKMYHSVIIDPTNSNYFILLNKLYDIDGDIRSFEYSKDIFYFGIDDKLYIYKKVK